MANVSSTHTITVNPSADEAIFEEKVAEEVARRMKEAEAEEKRKKAKAGIQVPPNLMKLITLLTLLISDADIIFTGLSFLAYWQGGFYVPIGIVGGFTLVYIGGCILAAREAGLFVHRFREKVRLNEIAGLTLEDMDQFFKGEAIAVPIPKSVLEQERERQEKRDTGGNVPTRAERLGHTAVAASNRQLRDVRSEGESGRADGIDSRTDTPREGLQRTNSRLPAMLGGSDNEAPDEVRWVTLGEDKKSSRAKYHADPERALFILCGHKDITFAFFRERRQFSRRVVLPVHSIPLIRLMVFGWQPTVSHTDFAGILNANALYSFTIGLPQFGCTIFYIVAFSAGDFTIWFSLLIGFMSIVLSVANLVLDFPKQLFDIAQREGEAHVFALQAEERSEFWEKKMEMEVQQRQEVLLRQSAIDGVQRPLSIIRGIIDIERECCHARVDYIAHQMQMALYESKTRMAIRAGELEEIPPRIVDFQAPAPPSVEYHDDAAAQRPPPQEPLQLTDNSMPLPRPTSSAAAGAGSFSRLDQLAATAGATITEVPPPPPDEAESTRVQRTPSLVSEQV